MLIMWPSWFEPIMISPFLSTISLSTALDEYSKWWTWMMRASWRKDERKGSTRAYYDLADRLQDFVKVK